MMNDFEDYADDFSLPASDKTHKVANPALMRISYYVNPFILFTTWMQKKPQHTSQPTKAQPWVGRFWPTQLHWPAYLLLSGLLFGIIACGLAAVGTSFIVAVTIGVAVFFGCSLIASILVFNGFLNSAAFKHQNTDNPTTLDKMKPYNKALIIGGFVLIWLGLSAAGVLPILMATGVFAPVTLLLFTLSGPLAILATTATIAGLTIMLGLAVLGLSSGRLQSVFEQIVTDKKMLLMVGLLFVGAAVAMPALVFTVFGTPLLPGLGLAGSILLFGAAATIIAPMIYFVASRSISEFLIAVMSAIGWAADTALGTFQSYNDAQNYVNSKTAKFSSLSWTAQPFAELIIVWRYLRAMINGVSFKHVNEKKGAYLEGAYHVPGKKSFAKYTTNLNLSKSVPAYWERSHQTVGRQSSTSTSDHTEDSNPSEEYSGTPSNSNSDSS